MARGTIKIKCYELDCNIWIYKYLFGSFRTFQTHITITLSVCLSTCLSVCLSVCLYVGLPVSQSVCQCVCVSVCLSVSCPSVCLFVCLSVCLSTCLPACLPVCLFVCLSARLSVRVSVCLSICQWSEEKLPKLCLLRSFEPFKIPQNFILYLIDIQNFSPSFLSVHHWKTLFWSADILNESITRSKCPDLGGPGKNWDLHHFLGQFFWVAGVQFFLNIFFKFFLRSNVNKLIFLISISQYWHWYNSYKYLY